MEPGYRKVRRPCSHLRHAGDIVHRDADCSSARFADRAVPHRIVPDVAAPADRHCDRAACRHPQHHLRHLGPVRVRAVFAAHAATGFDRLVRERANSFELVRRAAVRDRHSHRQSHSRHHGAAVRDFDFARRVRGGAARFEGSRLWGRLHDLGSAAPCGASLCAGWRCRRRHAESRPRARRDHGGDFRHRQCSQSLGVDTGARHHDLRNDRQRIHRGRRRPLHVVADCAGADPVRDHIHRTGRRTSPAVAARKAGGVSMDRYAWRRLRNSIVITLSIGATALGLGWLILILGSLVYEGLSGLSLAVFTQMTPPPGADGGLLNPIIGSLILTVLAILIGTPIGMLAGTYMAEYGKFAKLTVVVRFINDILLSAPSIVVGLFVYEILVAPMGHFSGWAGAVALALIVIPVVVRTTEDMLSLVPKELRESAAALGLPRAHVIRHVCYRAARAGIITGILLAIARISGETAPLLFTALNNQFFSANLNAPISSLPVVIFQFALSPYADWQKLAWIGALIITFAVLALSIVARALSASGKSS